MRGIIAQMNMLSEILSSRVRAEVFRLLFNITMPELHLREIARRSGLSESAVRQELGKLTRLDLLNRRKDGNRVYYAANRGHPLFHSIRDVVLKTVGLVAVLRSSLSKPGVQVAFVFGSVARAEETSDSDVDLMVIGNVGLRRLASMLSGIPEQIGREVNPHAMTETEYKRRLKAKDHLVTNVLDGPKMFVVGAEDDLAAMGE